MRIDVGGSTARDVLIPLLPDFVSRYPDIRMDLGVSDRSVDLISDNVDCVIRGGPLDSSSLIGRRLGEAALITCATPAYLKLYGRPAYPEELKNGHRLVSYVSSQTGRAVPFRFERDGQKLETYATGFRANNGIGVGPKGEVTSGDNDGSWVPKCPIHWVKPGSFNGVVDGAHRSLNSTHQKPDPAEEPKPICWLPKNVDNSGGGQVWVTSDRWGPFQGELLHMSYGTSSLYKVMMEEVGGVRQGGVVKFPLPFTSSAMPSKMAP